GSEKPEKNLGMDRFRNKWEGRAADYDTFPTGYFESPDGTQAALWVVSTASGLGAGEDDKVYSLVSRIVSDLHPTSFQSEIHVGLGGDIPNAKAEKDALISEAVVATSIVAALILMGVVWFYKSLWSLPLVFFPPLFGVGCAYAFATARYGFVNSSGAFLGAIIL